MTLGIDPIMLLNFVTMILDFTLQGERINFLSAVKVLFKFLSIENQAN